AVAHGFNPVEGSDAWARRVDGSAGTLLVGSLRTFLFVVLGAGVIFAHARQLLTTRALAWSLVALTAADLWTIDRIYWQFSPPAKVLYAPDAIVDYLKQQTQPARVLVFAPDDRSFKHPDPFFGTRGTGEGTGLM